MLKLWPRLHFSKHFRPTHSDSDSDFEPSQIISAPLYELKDPDPESLTTLISERIDPAQLMQIYRTHTKHFTNEHAILSLKISSRFTRLLKKNMSDDRFTLTFKKMIRQINENLPKLTPIDLMELLFCKSKFKIRGLKHLIEDIDHAQFIRTLKQQLKSDDYAIRHLINIHYDTIQLGVDLPELSDIIQKKINNPSTAELLQLARCELHRIRRRKKIDWPILNVLEKKLTEQLSLFDGDQLSHMYLYLISMQLHLQSENLCPMPILYVIQAQLLKDLTTLQEDSVMQILRATEYLPIYFPLELHMKIKSLVFMALKKRPAQISIYLILQCLQTNTDRITVFSDEEILSLKAVLVERLRLECNEYNHDHANKIGKILLKFQMKAGFEEYILKAKVQIPIQGFQYLYHMYGVNLDKQLEEMYTDKYIFDIYSMLSDGRFKNTLKSKIYQMYIKDDPLQFLSHITKLEFIGPNLLPLIEEAVFELVQRKSIPFQKAWSIIIKSILTQKISEYYKNWIKQRTFECEWILFKSINMNPFQADFFHFCFVHQLGRLSQLSIINIIQGTNMLSVLHGNHQLINCLIYKMCLLKTGIGVLQLFQYLSENQIDYMNLRLPFKIEQSRYEDIYAKTNCEIKLIILYILFIN